MNPADLYALPGQDHQWSQTLAGDTSGGGHLGVSNGYGQRMADFTTSSTSAGSVPFQQQPQHSNSQNSTLYASSLYGQPLTSSAPNNSNANGSVNGSRAAMPSTSFYQFSPYYYTQSTLPLSSYSTLQGATGPPQSNSLNGTPSTSQAAPPKQSPTTNIAIDPSLTSYGSPTNPYAQFLYSLPSAYPAQMSQPSQQQPQTMQNYQQMQPPQVISPAMLIRSPANYSGHMQISTPPQSTTPSTLASALIPPAQVYHQSSNPQIATTQRMTAISPPTVPSPTVQPSQTSLPQAAAVNSAPTKTSWRNLLPGMNALLTSETLDKTPERAAKSLISMLSSTDWNDLDKATRIDILTKIRDNAGKEFYQVWADSGTGIDIVQDWLRSTVTKSGWEDTIMPLLHVLDRLPLQVEHLQGTRLGRLLRKVVKDPPRAAAKDVAANIEAKWRKLVAEKQNSPPPQEIVNKKPAEEVDRMKKRKPQEMPLSRAAPPQKKPAVGPPTATKPTPVVKKDGGKSVTKDAKTDSSFFSSKPKPKLPSFRKVSVSTSVSGVKKEEPDSSVAQPNSIDPFQEALKSMGKAMAEKSPTPVGDSATPLAVKLGKNGKPKKNVSFAPAGKLELIKLIDKAIYDDDVGEAAHHSSYRDLDRDEGHALHSHVFEEQVDWYEAPLIELDETLAKVLESKGSDSLEVAAQTEREKSALMAAYMSTAQIPDTPSESLPNMDSLPTDESQMTIMLPGADVASLDVQQPQPAQPSLKDLLAKISLPMLGQSLPDQYSQSLNQSQPNEPPSHLAAYDMDLDGYQNYNQAEGMPWNGAPTQAHDPYNQYGQGGPNDPNWTGLPQGSGYQEEWEDESRVSRRRDPGWVPRGRGGGGGGRGRPNSKRVPCTFFQEGRCRHGESCNFIHEYV